MAFYLAPSSFPSLLCDPLAEYHLREAGCTFSPQTDWVPAQSHMDLEESVMSNNNNDNDNNNTSNNNNNNVLMFRLHGRSPHSQNSYQVDTISFLHRKSPREGK